MSQRVHSNGFRSTDHRRYRRKGPSVKDFTSRLECETPGRILFGGGRTTNSKAALPSSAMRLSGAGPVSRLSTQGWDDPGIFLVSRVNPEGGCILQSGVGTTRAHCDWDAFPRSVGLDGLVNAHETPGVLGTSGYATVPLQGTIPLRSPPDVHLTYFGISSVITLGPPAVTRTLSSIRTPPTGRHTSSAPQFTCPANCSRLSGSSSIAGTR